MLWNGVTRHTLALELKPRSRVDPNEIKRVVFLAAAAWVAVYLQLDKLLHSMAAITDNTGDIAACCGDHAVANHKQSMFVTGYETLDNDATAFVNGHTVSCFDVFLRREIGEHATTVVAVQGFDDHRQADVLRSFPGFVCASYFLPFWHRHTTHLQQAFG